MPRSAARFDAQTTRSPSSAVATQTRLAAGNTDRGFRHHPVEQRLAGAARLIETEIECTLHREQRGMTAHARRHDLVQFNAPDTVRTRS